MRKQFLKSISMLVAFLFLTSCATMPTATQDTARQADQSATQEAVTTPTDTQKSAQQAEQDGTQEAATTPTDTQKSAQQTEQGATKTAPNQAERQILRQAVTVGALAGAGVGAGVGAALSRKAPGVGALAGAAVGTLVGAIIGSAVAKRQIESYRNIRLNNEQFEKLLATAQEYNNSAATYNDNLQREITQIKSKTKPEQERTAKEKLKEAEEQRVNLSLSIDERQKLSQTLVQPQMVEYQKTLTDLDKEGQKLDGIITNLRSISEPARIGS